MNNIEYKVNGYEMLVGSKYSWMKHYVYQDTNKFYHYAIRFDDFYDREVRYYPQEGLISISSMNELTRMKGDINFGESLVDAIKEANNYEVSPANILPDKYNRAKKLREILD